MSDLSGHYSHRGAAPGVSEPDFSDHQGLVEAHPDVEEAPPTGEEIHMPEPSLIPILNAVGVTMTLLGVTTFRVLLIAGLILTAVTTIIWVRDTRNEILSLPAEHDHH